MKFYRKLKHIWRCWKKTRITSTTARELRLYPEVPQKPLKQIRKELYWLCRYRRRRSNTMDDTILDYFNMGIDRAGEDLKKYVFRREMNIARNSKQPLTCWILRDKWVTAQYLQSCGVETTRPLFVKTPFLSAEEALEKLRQSGHNKFFAKLVDRSLGKGAFPFQINDDTYEIVEEKVSGEELVARFDDCIVEPYIEQHEELNKLYPHAVSSLRIITICEDGKLIIFMAFLLAGAAGNCTSNLHQGGLRIRIKDSGELEEKGICLNDDSRGWFKQHPDTGVVFKDFKIPYWEQAVQLAFKAHTNFPKIHSVGWDIAITKNGPIIIEGNQHWVPHSFQYTYGPGRKLMEKYFNIK